MSFADEVRRELCELPVKKPCCRRSLATGLLLTARRLGPAEIGLRCRSEQVAALACEVLRVLYAKEPVVAVVGDHGHRYWDLTLTSPAAAKLVTRIGEAGAELLPQPGGGCEGCRAALVRGLFLVTGTVNDPEKALHLELLLPNDVLADTAARLLEAVGYPPRRIARRGGVGLYYKDSATVPDLLTLMGSHSVIFEFYNARIAADIRNNENRATNCVAKNIERSILAAARQMEAIGVLMAHGRLESLPEPLQVTALLRYRNPDATLDELRAMHVPAISKSGLSHRLQRLIDDAEQITKHTKEKP